MKLDAQKDKMLVGPLDLLVIQGTPFCNIDCKYCYLPNRLSQRRIEMETVELVLGKVFEFGIVKKDFTLVWHAGEPLVIPVEFYKQVSHIINIKNKTGFKLKQSIQTNGLLLNQEWCDFIIEHEVKVGLSLDGPSHIHDQNRVTRNGNGTHLKVMRAVELLHKNKIPFHVISVVTKNTLNHPDEFFNFFRENDIKQLGLNIEEVEGVHQVSTLTKDDFLPSFKRFMSRLYTLYLNNKRKLDIREFRQIESLILQTKERPTLSQQTTPYRILNVDVDGNFSTFSPELLGMDAKGYGSFQIGNLKTGSLSEALSSNRFDTIYSDIIKGIISCKKSCEYFGVCGGGAPSNKFSEHGSFAVAETNYCRFRNKALFDVVLSEMENTVGA